MEFVADANILVAGFLRSATTRRLLLDERLKLWVPERGLWEAEDVLSSERLRRRMGDLGRSQIKSLLSFLTSAVNILAESAYRSELEKAERIAPHPEDAPYLALALYLRCSLWSNDLALKNQKMVPVLTTQELLHLLYSR